MGAFSRVFPSWDENLGWPKRNLQAPAYNVEVIRRMDAVAIQELKRNLSGFRMLLEWLGSDRCLPYSDAAASKKGNVKSLGFVYDRRRVQHTGLAGEIVLPPRGDDDSDPTEQFARTSYAVGFQAGGMPFALVTAYILYGQVSVDRVGKIMALADYIAVELLA